MKARDLDTAYLRERAQEIYRIELLLIAHMRGENVEQARRCFEEWAEIVKGDCHGNN